jgi:hypothetical protein
MEPEELEAPDGMVPAGPPAELSIDDLTKAIEKLRVDALCADHALPPQAEAYYFLALAALEQAKQFATLAHYAEMQAR